MRKVLAFILAVSMMFTMVACGAAAPAPAPSAGNAQPGAPAVKENKDITIAMVAKHEGIAWFDDMRVGIEKFAADTGVNAYQIAPEGGDPAKQVQMVEDLIAQGVDAILVVPNDAQAMAPVLAKAREQGIVVVSHEASDLADVVDYDLEAFTNEEHGIRFAKELAEGMGGEGTYVSFVGMLTMTTHMQWFNAMQKHLEENYPNMKIINAEPYEDKNDTTLAYEKTLEVLKAHPDVKGFTDCAASSAGIAQALKDKNRKDITLVATATPSQGAIYLHEGWMKAGLAWQPADAGYVAAAIALKVIKGEPIANGDDYSKPGYQDVVMDGNIIYGNAPLVFKPDNVDNYNF